MIKRRATDDQFSSKLIDKVLCDLARRMGEAEKSRDAEFFKSLLAETLTFRRANKAVVDKATFLKDLLNPKNTYDMLESEMSATVQEGVAVGDAAGSRQGDARGQAFRRRVSQHSHFCA